jgi:hypothetical protein
MKHLATALVITCTLFGQARAETGVPQKEALSPLSAKQTQSGVGCLIVDLKGRTLTDGVKIVINSKSEALKKPTITKTTKKWLGESLEVTYTLGKGSLLEEESGFAPGKGPKGTLAISTNGLKFSMPAREVCNGDV